MSEIVAEFIDKRGETKRIHKTHHGLHVKRDFLTPSLAMSQAISKMMGRRIRDRRIALGLELAELALRCGMHSGHPKERVWAIENATRGHGVRMGTLYAIAHALGCQPSDFMPTMEEVLAEAKIKGVKLTVLS
jgi:hypothetical protein